MKKWLDKYKDISIAQNGIEGTMGGLTDIGFNYNGAWGGTMQMGGSMPGSVGFTYARTGGIPSNGPYAKKTKASAQDGTDTKKLVVKLSPEELKIERLKQYAQQQSRKEQPTVQSRGSMPDAARKQLYEDAQKNKLKNQLLKGADIATDIMQVGNFVPHPIGQAIGEAGNMLGGWVDAYQAYDAYNKGNYGEAAINAASVGLPMILGSNTFRRNSKYLQPGHPLYPLSPQAGILPGGYSRTKYIEPFTNVRGMTDKSLLANRALLGALGAETVYDSYQNGGEMKFYQEGLDWTPKNISRDGSEIPQAQLGTHMLTPDYSQVGENIMEMLSVPQKALTKLFSGKYQTPSEAMNIKNPVGAFAVDTVLDPVNLMGAGAVAKASTETGALSKAYKYNPFAFKPKDDAYYRMLGNKGYEDALKSGVIRPPQTQAGSAFENAYYSAGFPRDIRYRNLTGKGGYEGPYMAEVTGNSELFAPLEPWFPGDPLDITYSLNDVPVNKPGVKFYKEDWLKGYKKVKPPKKKEEGGEITKDDNGYWNPDNWGEPVEIGSNEITMQGVYEPLLGISDTGDTQMMYPGEDYEFDGESVTEYPIKKNGGWLEKYK